MKSKKETSPERCKEKRTWYQQQHIDSALGDLKKRKPRKFKNSYAYVCNICGWYHISRERKRKEVGDKK